MNDKELEMAMAMGDMSGMEDVLGADGVSDLLGDTGMVDMMSESGTDVINVDNTVLDADALSQVRIPVTIELGRTEVSWEQLQKLTKGSVLKLDAKKEDPLLLTVRGTPVAKVGVEVVDNEYQVVIQELKGN